MQYFPTLRCKELKTRICQHQNTLWLYQISQITAIIVNMMPVDQGWLCLPLEEDAHTPRVYRRWCFYFLKRSMKNWMSGDRGRGSPSKVKWEVFRRWWVESLSFILFWCRFMHHDKMNDGMWVIQMTVLLMHGWSGPAIKDMSFTCETCATAKPQTQKLKKAAVTHLKKEEEKKQPYIG